MPRQGYLTPSITSSPALEGIPLGISVDGVAIDVQKSQNSGQAVRNIEEEAGGGQAAVAAVLITILFQK